MKKVEIMYWVLNLLIMSLPFSWYLCYLMYKDLKKKDKIINHQNKIIDEKLK